MQRRINDALVNFVEHGDGVSLVALHGAGVDHREIEAAVEAVIPSSGYRRIYPDLPGMGLSTTDGLASNSDVVDLLIAFIEQLDAGPVMLVGHSYGSYLARGVAARRPATVRGLALLCPLDGQAEGLPAHEAVREDPDAYDELDESLRAGFDEYFVVRTAATARRYSDSVVPGTALVDEDALRPLFNAWTIDLGAAEYTGPSLIVAGRRDSTAGYAHAIDLLEPYPRATLAVIDDAGHALIHEKPELLAQLLGNWLEAS